jgi:DNA repair exonuclease SbcCD ATPase subunit|tara:strand:- start:926 stop:2641 length:1716 start_codon:yes stop_codon:yes gene_type:complete
MIHFKSVSWKNFLSTGSDTIKIQLDRTPSTLIVGSNGAGKSTMLDALSYGLFGKPHRDIKKDQLINSINKKGTVVEVEFDVGNSEFKIIRAIRPGKFEIWQNGNQINQASNARDFQKYLEQNILKLNHKSFHQVVVLGSSSFIPFMQLPTWQRRAVIEDLLDINIFSKMNMLLKERNSKIKEELSEINHSLDLFKTKIESQTKYIRNLQAVTKDMVDSKEESIVDYKVEIEGLFKQSQDLGLNLSTYLQHETTKNAELKNRESRLKSYDINFKSKIKDLVEQSKFFDNNEHCPTCDQDIDEDIRNEKIKGIKASAVEIQKGMADLKTEMDQNDQDYADGSTSMNFLLDKQRTINSNNDKIGLIQKEIDKIQKEIKSLGDSGGDIKTAKTELEDMRGSKDSITEKKLEYVEERTYNEVIGEMLKDTGIKTKVIKQYLPVMNKLINSYLQTLDFFVAFHLDEAFNETIRSRHRDAFNYASFSEGEKQRIDLSLLFTWRQIAKMKNSAATNLLVLDETFDSSLDVDGVENLTKILSTLEEGTNVFIISHKGDILENKFRSKIEFIKDRNFSKIK